MTTSYPGAVDNLTNPTPSDTLNSATVPHAAQHANVNDAVEAIQTTLGTNPQGSAATVAARIAALEGGTGAAGMTWKGDYMPNAYSPGDTVRYQGDLWVCLNAVTGGASAPTPPDWERAVDVPAAVDAYTKAEADAKFATKTALAATDAQLLTTTQALDTRVPGEAGSNQPAGTPPNGYVWVNTTDNSIKVWNGTAYVDPSNAGGGGPTWAVASGGTESTITDGGTTYRLHRFNANGTLNITQAGQVEVLVVGPGGGGYSGGAFGGGGGAVQAARLDLGVGAVTVTVGTGGATGAPAATGSPASKFGDITAPGGTGAGATIPAGGPPTGGIGANTAVFTGGGGAVAGITPPGTGTSGGAGFVSTISGASVEYGRGGNSAGAATPANTGQGGGGNGFAGSSGTVLVRYEI